MPGRPSKPVELLLREGKSHRTKAELSHRAEAEQVLYTGVVFKESAQTKADPIAHKEFQRLKQLYKSISYVDALDQNLINRYCLEVSSAAKLQELADKMAEKLDEVQDLDTGDLIQLYKSINGVLSKIKASKELLLKYEDRLFLTPTGRIKAIPKTPQEKDNKPIGISAFLQKRAESG